MNTASLGIYHKPLEMLAGHLRGHGLTVDTVMGGLVVTDGTAKVVVTCRPRAVDGDALWFYTEPDQQPIVEAHEARMMDAVVAIKGRLAVARWE